MKKVLLSLSMLAAMMTANAQSIEVGKGAYDDFATFGNSTDNPSGEYNMAVGAQTAGIFWYTDAAFPASYTKTRSNGEMAIAVNKTVAGQYSVIGLGFGDDNGAAAGGAPFYIDCSGATTFSVKLKASVATDVRVQFEDVNGKKAEANPTTKAEYTSPTLTTSYQTYTVNFGTGIGLDWSDATCGPPATKPCVISGFDASKVAKINFLISASGGAPAYTGVVTFDDLKIGKTAYVGLGTISSANIGSTVIFPNPAENAFTAEVNLKSAANVTINVSDMMGNVVRTETLGNVVSASKEINVSGLAKGMYTVTYILDGTPAKAEKIMVK